jgi:hypothetical protein
MNKYRKLKKLLWCITFVKYQGIASIEIPCETPEMELATKSNKMACLFFKSLFLSGESKRNSYNQ